MKTIKTTIAILVLSILTFSCSKEDAPAPTPVKQPSAAVSFENTTEMPILDALYVLGPDEPTTTTSNINVTANGTILDLKKMIFEMNVEHTYQLDLRFTLIAPDGTESLFIRNIGQDKNYVSTNKLRFCATFTNAMPNQNIDIPAGDYKESQKTGSTPVLLPIFSTLQDKSITGNWKLKVSDHDNSDTGSIKSWKLIFETGALNQ